MTTNKAKLSAAVKSAAKKAAAPVAKTAKTKAAHLDETFAILKAAGKKGITIPAMAEKLAVEENKVRRYIDQVRARGWYVDRVAACTFTLGAAK